ncbi:hypothetical protein Q3G72_002651 [Acer saccharum]|nr:hypothetical protein Q3G72_002651 [Acer saccharum]
MIAPGHENIVYGIEVDKMECVSAPILINGPLGPLGENLDHSIITNDGVTQGPSTADKSGPIKELINNHEDVVVSPSDNGTINGSFIDSQIGSGKGEAGNKVGRWKRVNQKQRGIDSKSDLGENLGKRKSLISSNQPNKKRNEGETWAQRFFSSELSPTDSSSGLRNKDVDGLESAVQESYDEKNSHKGEKSSGLYKGKDAQIVVGTGSSSLVTPEGVSSVAKFEDISTGPADLYVQSESRYRVNKLIRKWEPPDEGMYKSKCDIVVDRIAGKIGFGTVIRDSKEEVMASCAQSMMANLSLKSAKLVAVWKSITFSKDCGLNPCAFELDEACAVKWIQKGGHRESVHGRILDDIGEVVFCHTDRGANKVARGLAKFALKSNDDTFWMEDFPSCVRILVEADMPT